MDTSAVPIVQWMSAGDRAKVWGPDRVFEETKEIVQKTWNRIPEEDRRIICPVSVSLYSVRPDEAFLNTQIPRERCGSGYLCGDIVCLNVGLSSGQTDEDRATWALARRFAELYDRRIRNWAVCGVKAILEGKRRKGRKKLCSSIAAALECDQDDECFERQRLRQVRHEAQAVCWGFGFEFGFTHDQILDPEPFTFEGRPADLLAYEFPSILKGARASLEKDHPQ